MIIAHVDMDCFFCACELKRDPSLADKPIMVGATGERGVISAANYEARKFGVFSATPISKARNLCPDGIFLRPDFELYRQESDHFMEILQDIADDFVQVSIDEAYLDLTEYSKIFDSLHTMAQFIKKLIKKKTRLTCSIGIANSRIISKIASDFNKPDGITIVDNPKEFLKELPIEKIPGIGKVSKRHYHQNNIYKIGDLVGKDKFWIIDRFGQHGIYYQNVALGLDTSGLVHHGKRKSISRERTFMQDCSDEHIINNKFQELCNKVHDDLGTRSFKTISIKVRYSDFTTITKDRSLNIPTNSLELIRQNIFHLWNQCEKQNIRLIGVKLSNLTHHEKQLTLDQFF